MLEEAAHAAGRRVQPAGSRVTRGADGEAVGRDAPAACAVGERGVRAVAYAGFQAAVDFGGEEGGVGVDGEEVAAAFDHVFFLLREGREQVAESRSQALWVVAVGPGPAEPAKAEVEVALTCHLVAGGCAVGFEVVSAVLECDSVRAFELFVVPFGNLGVREKRVVTTEEAGLDSTSDVVGRWVILSGGIVGVLPVAVLGLVDSEPFIHVGVIAGNDVFGVVEEVVDNTAIGPSTIFIEESKWCIPVEKLEMSVPHIC